jgi:hypothetical protein
MQRAVPCLAMHIHTHTPRQAQIAAKFPAEQYDTLLFVNPAALQSILSVRLCVFYGAVG